MTEEQVNGGEEKKEEEKKEEVVDEKVQINLDNNPVVKIIKGHFSEDVTEAYCFQDKEDELTLRVKKEKIKEVGQFVKNHPELEFTYLCDITGVDYPDREQRFDLVYHLYSVNRKLRLRLRISFREDETVDSVTPVWAGAEAYEREAFDMLGIKFEGHPNLKRILMPDDWEGHPYRKDYPLEDQKTPKQRLSRPKY